MLIFVLILALNLMMPRMIKWVNDNDNKATDTISQTDVDNASAGKN